VLIEPSSPSPPPPFSPAALRAAALPARALACNQLADDDDDDGDDAVGPAGIMADGSPRRFNYGGGEHEHGAGAVARNALPPASPADARGGVAGAGGTGGGGDHREAVSVNAMAWYVPVCTHPPGVRPDQVPGPRAAHSANLIGNKLYLFGGCEISARARARLR
jgi:hypothetical protein